MISVNLHYNGWRPIRIQKEEEEKASVLSFKKFLLFERFHVSFRISSIAKDEREREKEESEKDWRVSLALDQVKL